MNSTALQLQTMFSDPLYKTVTTAIEGTLESGILVGDAVSNKTGTNVFYSLGYPESKKRSYFNVACKIGKVFKSTYDSNISFMSSSDDIMDVNNFMNAVAVHNLYTYADSFGKIEKVSNEVAHTENAKSLEITQRSSIRTWSMYKRTDSDEIVHKDGIPQFVSFESEEYYRVSDRDGALYYLPCVNVLMRCEYNNRIYDGIKFGHSSKEYTFSPMAFINAVDSTSKHDNSRKLIDNETLFRLLTSKYRWTMMGQMHCYLYAKIPRNGSYIEHGGGSAKFSLYHDFGSTYAKTRQYTIKNAIPPSENSDIDSSAVYSLMRSAKISYEEALKCLSKELLEDDKNGIDEVISSDEPKQSSSASMRLSPQQKEFLKESHELGRFSDNTSNFDESPRAFRPQSSPSRKFM